MKRELFDRAAEVVRKIEEIEIDLGAAQCDIETFADVRRIRLEGETDDGLDFSEWIDASDPLGMKLVGVLHEVKRALEMQLEVAKVELAEL